MSWAKLDDGHDDSRKARRACREGLYGLAALGLHVLAISQSARRETNGAVDLDWLDEKLRKLSARERERLLALADELGLFDTLPAGESRDLKPQRGPDVTVGPFDDDHILVHDYLDYNDSSEYLKARRKADADRKANGSGRGGSAGSQEDSEGIPDGLQTESVETSRVRPRGRARAQVGSGREEENNNDTSRANVVTFNRRPVPASRLALAEQVLADFNAQAGTSLSAYTASGKSSDSLGRIIGALTEYPDDLADLDACRRVTAAALKSGWFNGPANVGVVFGPGVVQQNIERAKTAGPRRTDVAGALDRAYGRTAG